MKKLGLLVLLLLSPAFGLTDAQELSVHAVRRESTDPGTAYLRQGKQLAEFDNNYASALRCYQKAASFFQKNQNWEKYIETLNGIGRVYNDLAEYPKAERYIREALGLAQKHLGETDSGTAYSYASLASVQARSIMPDSALFYNKKALSIYSETLGPDASEVGMILFQIGFAYLHRSDFDKAIEYAQKSLNIRLKRSNVDTYVASSYAVMGYAYSRKGDHAKGLEYAMKGLEIRRRLFGERHRLIAASYNDIAQIYEKLKDYNKQLKYYKYVLTIEENIFGENSIQVGETYRFISFAYMEMGDFSKQIECMEKALKVFSKVYGKSHPQLFFPYLHLGNAYLKLDEREKALQYYQKAYRARGEAFNKNDALEMAPYYTVLAESYRKKGNTQQAVFYLNKASKVLQKNRQAKYPIMAEVQNMQGELFLESGNFSQALKAFQQGLVAISDEFHSLKPEDNPDAERSNSKYLLLSLLANKASALSHLGESQEENSCSETALKTYEAAMRLLDRLRIGLNTDEFKEKITAKYASVYEGAVETAQRLYEQTNEETYPERAFYASERSKAFLLHEASAESRAKEFVGIPEALLRQEKELKTAISYYEEQILKEKEARNSTFIRAFESQISMLREKLEALIKQFEKKYPQYYALKYQTEPLSIQELRASLEKNTTLAEYMVGERNLYVFLIDKAGLKLVKTKSPEASADRIKKLQTCITTRNFKGYAEEANLLYEEFFAPIRPYLTHNRITVVPDGPLWHLNFELLLSRPAPGADYTKLSYLLKEYTFGYAYSATLLYENRYKKIVPQEGQCLAFSFSGACQNREHVELPGAKAELQAIAKTREGKFLSGKDAGEAAFKRLAPNYSILHLALHGEADDQHSERSAVYFPLGKQTGSGSEDGVLYASELYNMQLHADLAVLSACNTGNGKHVKGEGIISLGRAFAYAGCKSLVMSLWEVSDATAPELMEQFYKNLEKGIPKDEALRRAKLTYLSSADNLSAGPFYWGSFVLLGDSDPLSAKKKELPQQADFRSVLATILLLSLFHVYFRQHRETRALF